MSAYQKIQSKKREQEGRRAGAELYRQMEGWMTEPFEGQNLELILQTLGTFKEAGASYADLKRMKNIYI